MIEDYLYRRTKTPAGRVKYEKVPHSDWRGFPCDGVWVVQKVSYGHSSQCVLKIGELQTAYPFVQMAHNLDDLACFIMHWYDDQKRKTGEYDDKGNLISYTIPSYTEMARDILKFLAELSNKRYENP